MTSLSQPRASSSVAFRVAEAIGGTLIKLIAGAALFIPGTVGLYSEMHVSYQCDEPIHSAHIYIFVALMAGGALILQPTFGKTLTNIFVTVLPNGLPLVGGRRASDPPKGDPT